ncbi:MAG TPA: adenylate/guanylate cyclase domain-containing protein [Gaiellaceae bacterium]|nr:adenylate/guanylate cyclase domain-containing protein [Gaiellaceae bacterium]
MAVCPRCGEENAKRARFCSACGASLGSEPGLERDVRKTVTVVFSDVIGSTSLGEDRDPESMRRVMSRYFDEAQAVHERHGGTVEKFIGDAVMAVFGIPQLHEDDALRAVRAAAELRDRLEVLNEELLPEWGVELQVRTGVNTGEVVAGDSSGGQKFATGDAVNVAKRFEQAAQPNEILLGESTYRLVRDAVTVEPVEPLELKGKKEPVAAYRLLDVGAEPRGTGRRLDAPMIGRDNERALLEQAYSRVVREQSCHLFTLLGPAGVGKSRLAAEVVNQIGDDATVLVGRCLPYGEGITFWPLVEIVRQAARLEEGDSPQEARSKIEALLGDAEDAPTIAQRVGEAVGFGSGLVSSEETFWGVRKLFEALARLRPLIVVLDDIHWAEPTFLDLVEHVGDWAREAILVLCLARSDLIDQRPTWGGGKFNATSILLEPLSEEESALLIENLLGRSGLSGEAIERIAQAAEGNPLFVEEMVGMLIDEGLLEARNGEWIAKEGLGDVSVPPTIHALLAARLDRLDGSEREVIQRASVEGKVFHRSALLELAPEILRENVPNHLLTLQRKELIRPSRSDFAGDDAFRFRHLLIRDAAYEALPKQLRAELHERFALWLEEAAGERALEYEEILGYHLEQAYRYRVELGPEDEHSGRLARLAAEHLAQAGRRAVLREDWTAAQKLLERAVVLYEDDDPERPELLLDLGEARSEKGLYGEAEAALSDAIARADAAGDRGIAARAQVVLAFVQLFSDPEGRGDDVLRVSEEATRVFRELGDDRSIAKTALLTHQVLFQRGDLTGSRRVLVDALPHAGRSGDPQLEPQIRSSLVSDGFWGHTPVAEVEKELSELDGFLRRHRLRLREYFMLRVSAVTLAMSGRIDEGRNSMRRANAILGDLGPGPYVVMAQAEWEGYLELLAGDYAAAERVQRTGYDILEGYGEKAYRSTLAGELAQSLYELARFDEAEQFAEAGREAAATDDVSSQSLWRGVKAKVLARRGELARAEGLAREGVALMESTEFLMHHAWALSDLGEVLELAGRPAEAGDVFRRAIELHEQKGNVVMAARIGERLSRLAIA